MPEAVVAACGVDNLTFGKEYIIPKPLDPRLLMAVSSAVARAAVETGVAQRPYREDYPA